MCQIPIFPIYTGSLVSGGHLAMFVLWVHCNDKVVDVYPYYAYKFVAVVFDKDALIQLVDSPA